MDALKGFKFKACTLNDEKSQQLYDALNPDKGWLKPGKGKLKIHEPQQPTKDQTEF